MSQTATLSGAVGCGGAMAAMNEAAQRCQRKIAELRQAIVETVTKEHIAAIIRTLAERAAAGSETAAKLVLQYAVGRGQVAVERERGGAVGATVARWRCRSRRRRQPRRGRAGARASAGRSIRRHTWRPR